VIKIEDGVQCIEPRKAWQFIQKDSKSILIDVRSTMEFLFVGHPKGAIHIAWIDEPDWDINENFVTEVRNIVLGNAVKRDESEESIQNAPIFLICRSGVRSLDGGKALVKAGFTQVFNIEDGFEGPRDVNHHRSTLGGWRFHGLPWEQC
jgi:rhodanese-related sulfurtransferase